MRRTDLGSRRMEEIMSTKSSVLACFGLAVILFAVGCAASSPAASAVVFPSGNFAAIDNAAGRFDLEIKNDGNFTITFVGVSGGTQGAGAQKTAGTYTVSQDRVMFQGSFCDSGDRASGMYTWNYDGKTLTFNSSDDTCMDRWRALNYVWTKQ